jgi:hypothetical protein
MQLRGRQLLDQCHEHAELDYLSIDATVKCAFKIIGQSTYHASAEARNAAVISDDEALYRVLTVRGRTGAVLLITGIKSETSSLVAAALKSGLSDSHRAQVRHVASDNLSGELSSEH